MSENQKTKVQATAQAVDLQTLVSSRRRWITSTLCILSFSLGLYLGQGLGQGKEILYIGSDNNKYNNAIFGCLIKQAANE